MCNKLLNHNLVLEKTIEKQLNQIHINSKNQAAENWVKSFTFSIHLFFIAPPVIELVTIFLPSLLITWMICREILD